ncbi:hypothetical protein HPB50_005796 [Hyalomma asiaticum]|uniref:Uncharacterized protein n=1 Tax=Hyalomma asiaticum TaxID=266040 RepID=A0ACB7RMU4_HYAAI|nr:hypothetical protein HPB50_005796 [Hyalomma asiaticum]
MPDNVNDGTTTAEVQLAEHRTGDSKVAGSDPVEDSLALWDHFVVQRANSAKHSVLPEVPLLRQPTTTSYAEALQRGTPVRADVAAAAAMQPPMQAILTFDTEEDFYELCIADDDVTIPPRSSMCVAVTNRAFSDLEGIADSNTRLILEKGICMARGLVQLRDGCANVLITNFGNEVQHLAKGTVIASLNDFVHVSELSIPEAPTPDLQDVDSDALTSEDIARRRRL